MKRTTLGSCVAAFALACAETSLAQDHYRAEAGVDYLQVDGDSSGAVNTKSFGVFGAYYLRELPRLPSDYPLDQAPFVERAGELNASYRRTESELDSFDTTGSGSSWNVGFIFRRPDTPLFFAASFGASDSEKFRSRTSGSEFEIDSKSYALSGGAYVAKNTLVGLSWSESRVKTRNTTSTPKSTDTTIGIFAQHLFFLPGATHLALNASLSQTEDETDGSPTEKNQSLSLAGTYYPTKRLGLTLGYAYDTGDDRFNEGQAFLVGARYFITPAFSVFGSLQTFQGKDSDADFDFLSLGVALRF